jgi:hypothetical protein
MTAFIGSWLVDDLVDRVFLAPLAEDGVLDHCLYVSRDFEAAVAVASPAALRTQSSIWGYDLVSLRSEDDFSNPDCEVTLNLDTDAVTASVLLGGDVLAGFIDRLVPLAQRWIADGQGHHRFDK